MVFIPWKTVKYLLIACLLCEFESVYCDTCVIPAVCKCQIDITPPPNPNATTFAIKDAADICNMKNSSVASKSPNVILNCTYADIKSNTTKFPEKADDKSFYLTLNYPCSRPEPPPSPHTASYSTGSILLIVFFTCLFAYLALGMAVNYFILGARGVEIIPNLSFWQNLPGLVKDGVVFVQNGFKVPQSEIYSRSPESYDAI